jgi:hypothetical protein
MGDVIINFDIFQKWFQSRAVLASAPLQLKTSGLINVMDSESKYLLYWISCALAA